MQHFRWCSRCHCGFDVASAGEDSRGDLFCPLCGASSVFLMHWDYARSLHRSFPEWPEPLQVYPPRQACG